MTPLARHLPSNAMAIARAGAHRMLHEAARARVALSGGGEVPTSLDLNNDVITRAAAKLGVEVQAHPSGFLRLSHGGNTYFSHESDFPFESVIPWQLCGDKRMVSTILADAAIPVPPSRTFGIAECGRALEYFRESPKPLVVKPASGSSGGQSVTLNVSTARAFRSAFARAAAVRGNAMVEAQVPGQHVRVTILDAEVLGVVRRHPSYVVGDGHASIEGLVSEKNELWRSRSPSNRLVVPITIDAEVRGVLRRSGLGLSSVPAPGEAVQLRDICNRGEIEDIAEQLHPDYIDLALAAADALGPVMCAVDLIVRDIRSPTPGSFVVGEVNTTPALYIANALVDGSPSTYAAERALRHLFSLDG